MRQTVKRTRLITVTTVFIFLCASASANGFLAGSITAISPALAAPAFANDQFKQVWQYSDKLVDEVPGAGRSYTWGPNSFGILTEPYQEGNGGQRQVQYFDKSRMELSKNGSLVTNGLLTRELVTGQRQDGDATFTQLTPSQIPVAGDSNQGGANPLAPTYASFQKVITYNPSENRAADRTGQVVNQTIDKVGAISTLANPPTNISLGYYDPTLGHNVPAVFVNFQNQTGQVWDVAKQAYTVQKIYTDNPTVNVFGYPISEAYWSKAVVGEVQKDVLIQLFERRVLTYTPSNSAAFQVEMGNIGQHYYTWRYTSSTTPATPNPTPPVLATTAYYVAPNGSDTNPGTQAQPWQTIQKAANTAGAGSTVYVRNGIYHEMVTINHSGNQAQGYINFQNYPDESPVLDGSGLTISAAASAAFLINSQSYVSIQGFEIRNYITASGQLLPAGIYITGKGSHLQLINNRIHNIENNYTGNNGNAHGIGVYGTDSSTPISDLKINGNQLYNLKLGASESLAINGNVTNFEVANNSIHDNNNIGIDVIGFEGNCPTTDCDQAREGIIKGNTVYNIVSAGNPAYGDAHSADGIYVDGGRNIIIEQNTVYASDIGIELASEHGGKATSFVTVRNNLVYHNLLVGITIGGYDQQRGAALNCQIVNNTLFENDTLNSGTGEFGLQYNTQNNVFKNNLVYASANGVLISNNYTQNSNNQLDNNLYFVAGGGSGSWQWKQATYASLADYRSGTGNEANSLFADPLLTSLTTPDLHPSATSPVINAGQNLDILGDTDAYGNARIQGGRVDIGAVEVR